MSDLEEQPEELEPPESGEPEAASDDDDEEGICPVCEGRTMEDNLDSQGIVMTGVKALLENDKATIENIYASLTSYDGHTAIGMCAALLHDLCIFAGIPMERGIEQYQQGLLQARTSLFGPSEAGDSGSSD